VTTALYNKTVTPLTQVLSTRTLGWLIAVLLSLYTIPETGWSDEVRLDAYHDLMLSQERPLSTKELIVLYRKLGNIGQGSEIVAKDKFKLGLIPSFRFENNINGGNPTGPLILGDAVFIGDPTFNKKSGTVADLKVQLQGRFLVGLGKYADLKFTHQVATSLHDRVSFHLNLLGGCYHHFVRSWNYIDVCGMKSVSSKALSSDDSMSKSLSFTRLVHTNSYGNNMLTLGVGLENDDGVEQRHYFIRLNNKNIAKTDPSFTVKLGELPKRFLSLDRSFEGRFNLLYNETLSVNLYARYAHYKGGQILGFPRNETHKNIIAEIPIAQHVIASFGYFETDSNINYFDERGPIFGLYFTNFEF